MKTFREAIETGETDFIHPVLRKELESGKEDVLKFLPEKAQEYYEMIISDNYHKILERVEYYTKVKPTDQTIPQIVSLAMSCLNEIAEIERGHKTQLEKMAVDLVLSYDIYSSIKKDIENKDVIIDAKLGEPDLKDILSQNEQEKNKLKKPKQDGDLSPLEEMDMGLADEFENEQEDRLRRRLVNTLTQGQAIGSMYLFNNLKDELNKINDKLFYKYGIVSSMGELGYFLFDPRRSVAMFQATAQGSEQVIPKEDKYVIKARATTFPYLVQEIVKGIEDLISTDPNKAVPEKKVEKQLKGDYVEQEIKDTVAGPELAKHITKMIDILDTKYYPYIKQEVLKLPVEEFKILFKKDEDGEPSKEAKDLMRIIVKKAKKIVSDAEID